MGVNGPGPNSLYHVVSVRPHQGHNSLWQREIGDGAFLAPPRNEGGVTLHRSIAQFRTSVADYCSDGRHQKANSDKLAYLLPVAQGGIQEFFTSRPARRPSVLARIGDLGERVRTSRYVPRARARSSAPLGLQTKGAVFSGSVSAQGVHLLSLLNTVSPALGVL